MELIALQFILPGKLLGTCLHMCPDQSMLSWVAAAQRCSDLVQCAADGLARAQGCFNARLAGSASIMGVES